MNVHEPRPLEGDELAIAEWDAWQCPCRECRTVDAADVVAMCPACRVPLCWRCWRAHLIADVGPVIACRGRSFQDTQEGE